MTREREWLWGWDETPGIVAVWAELSGAARIWRRLPGSRELVREDVRFRSWLVLSDLEDLAHLGPRLRHESEGPAAVSYRILQGPGALRYLVHSRDGEQLLAAVQRGAAKRLGHGLRHVRELGPDRILVLPPEEQYLVASGRTYYRGMAFDELVRMQIDLETTGLDPERDRIFLIAVRNARGEVQILEREADSDAGEAALLQRLVALVQAEDPDVIENHNLHGFDLPFLARRAKKLQVTLALGRDDRQGLRARPASRGASFDQDSSMRRMRWTMPGRELIDTMDAVWRYDFALRELPGHGLKAVAKHLGIAGPDREHVPGARVYEVYRQDPARVRRYAEADVHEAAGLTRLLGGAAFALAQMVPRRYERLADAGAATGVLDPLLVRAYLRSRCALPVHQPPDGTTHSGAALHLFATGVATRVVKADVASLYPSLMREYRIGPARDHLGVLVALVGQLVDQRLEAKAKGQAALPGSAERHTYESLSAAMKLVVNSAYGYLGAASLTRFSDVHAANEVTRRGRELLDSMCRELAARGVTLLEADTDGVYFAVPASFDENDERRVVAEVAALLPRTIKLEFEGRYAAMLSHEPKNYALLPYQGPLVMRGVAFRSSRSEPFGEAFLRRALHALLAGDIPAVREAYVHASSELAARRVRTQDVCARMRLRKTPEEYAVHRNDRRELAYEALLEAGRTHWRHGERIHVYRRTGRRAGLLGTDAPADPCDYDVEHYLRLLRETFAERLARAFRREDFEALFSDPRQPSLFAPTLTSIRPILTVLANSPAGAAAESVEPV